MSIIYRFILIFGIAAFVGSCSKLDLTPSTSLPTDVAISDIPSAQAALFGAYSLMQATGYYGRNMSVMAELGSDNVYISKINSGRLTTSYTRIYTSTDGDVTALWNNMYRVIAAANNIINRIDAVAGIQEEKNVIKGQALFIRALVYFDLSRVFAKPYNQDNGGELGVPIVLQSQEGAPARNTLTEVYDRIINDLKNSKTLLSGTNASSKFTANQYAVSALLSRVYLYKEDNSNAIAEANAVINAGYTLTPVASLAGFYSTPGTPEEIFTLKFTSNQTTGAEDFGNLYLQNGYGDVRVSPDLINIFDTVNDKRYKKFIVPFTNNSNDEYQNIKFSGQDGVQALHSPKILRLAEVILNRAEAYVKTSNFAQALVDLNTIRTNRGLAALVTVPDNQLLDSVLVEKRREFMFEGHRFFDLIRNKKAIERNYCNQPTQMNNPNCNIPYNDSKVVSPIPQREMDANPNMQQNPGY